MGANLTLNVVWKSLFFRRKSARAGPAGTVLLDFSNAHLIRCMAVTDRPAAAALAPYAA